jgi:Fic family protein
MSALWKAEIRSLERLVIHKENERATEAAQSARWSHRPKRTAHLNTATDRAGKRNKTIVLDCIKSAKQPMSANKVSEHTGLTDTTTRKHLVALEEEGAIQSISTKKQQKRYFFGTHND